MERAEFDYWKPRDVARLLSLVEAERRYFQEMMAMLPVGIALVTADLEVTLTNRAFRKLLGVSRDNIAEKRLDQLVGIGGLPERVREAIQEGAVRSLLDPVAHTTRGPRSLLITLQPFRNWDSDATTEVLVTLEDVSDVMRAQLPLFVPVKEIDAAPAPALPEAAAAPPMPASEPTHAPAAFAEAPLPAPALLPPVFEGLLWRLDAESMRFETVQATGLADLNLPPDSWRAGADFWTGRIASAHLPLVKGFYDLVLKGAGLHSCEYRATTTTGRSVWLRDVIRPRRDNLGTITSIDGGTYDVTAVRQREDSVVQAVKVDALSRLSGRVAHECNNLLTILGGHGEELLHGLPADNPLRGNAQEILTAGDRLSGFTQQLHAYVKHPSPDTTNVNLDTLLTEFRPELRQLLPSSIRLMVNTNMPGAVAVADPALLIHAMRTFALRGAEAMRGEGTLTVETSGVVLADASAASRAALPAGRYLQLSVRDTGHAIHPDMLQQLFEPPTSGDAPRHNLAAIYKSVREMGGDLTASSEFDRGTCLQLLVPRTADADATVPVAAPPQTAEPEAPVMETILVVEDEAGIRGLIRRILSRQGYRILEASNGRNALDAAREYEGTIHMLLTDVVMPELGGFELSAELLKDRPGTRVLFISGYTGLSGFDASQLPAGSGFLQKPFTLNALLAKVREVFSAAR